MLPTRSRAVLGARGVGVLEGGELVLALDLEAGELGEVEPLEVVEDELLELDAVRLGDVGDGDALLDVEVGGSSSWRCGEGGR